MVGPTRRAVCRLRWRMRALQQTGAVALQTQVRLKYDITNRRVSICQPPPAGMLNFTPLWALIMAWLPPEMAPQSQQDGRRPLCGVESVVNRHKIDLDSIRAKGRKPSELQFTWATLVICAETSQENARSETVNYPFRISSSPFRPPPHPGFKTCGLTWSLS